MKKGIRMCTDGFASLLGSTYPEGEKVNGDIYVSGWKHPHGMWMRKVCQTD